MISKSRPLVMVMVGCGGWKIFIFSWTFLLSHPRSHDANQTQIWVDWVRWRDEYKSEMGKKYPEGLKYLIWKSIRIISRTTERFSPLSSLFSGSFRREIVWNIGSRIFTDCEHKKTQHKRIFLFPSLFIHLFRLIEPKIYYISYLISNILPRRGPASLVWWWWCPDARTRLARTSWERQTRQSQCQRVDSRERSMWESRQELAWWDSPRKMTNPLRSPSLCSSDSWHWASRERSRRVCACDVRSTRDGARAALGDAVRASWDDDAAAALSSDDAIRSDDHDDGDDARAGNNRQITSISILQSSQLTMKKSHDFIRKIPSQRNEILKTWEQFNRESFAAPKGGRRRCEEEKS